MSPAGERPQYTVYRSRRRILRRAERPGDPLSGRPRRPRDGGAGRSWKDRVTFRRAVIAVLAAVVGWIALSAVLFLISAQIQEGKVAAAAEEALDPGGFPLTSATNVLVLGSDERPKGTREGGANASPARADSIMLMRVGAGHSGRLSIPRDTIVDIPDRGPDKINAAYAIGGPQLMIRTVKSYLGVEVHHLVEVSFENFPKLIDALGGIDYTGGCVISKINGGYRNGGVTLRLRRGMHHLDGKRALALARTRTNLCNPRESDLSRARRQQKILSAMKSRLFSPATFVRLPWVSWQAPRALQTDMAGPSLLGLAGALSFAGSSKTRVLKPSGVTTLPNGGLGLQVSDAERRAEVRRFLRD